MLDDLEKFIVKITNDNMFNRLIGSCWKSILTKCTNYHPNITKSNNVQSYKQATDNKDLPYKLHSDSSEDKHTTDDVQHANSSTSGKTFM